MVIGLTGGSGCGKTTALTVLQELGAVCYDADAVYHELLRTDAAMLREIGAAFPGSVENGVLQRKRLGAQVFGNPEALRRLSAITHPYVVRAIRAQLGPGLSVIDAFGLIESGLGALCDCTVAVTAPTEARVERLMAREGVSRTYAEARIAAQKTNEEFSASCMLTLCNDGSREAFREKCRTIFEKWIKEKETDGKPDVCTEKRL